MAALMKNANSSATVESSVAKRMASRFDAVVGQHLPGLHDGRVQVEVVRHHRGAQDADRDVEHRRVGHDLGASAAGPAATAAMAGRAMTSSTAKQTPIVATSAMTNASR